MPWQKILGRDEAERLALEALAFLAGDEDRLFRFLDRTGLGPETIRQAAASPGFLAAVLDYVVTDEPLMIDLARTLAVGPERIMAAREKLSPSDPTEPVD